MPIDYRIQKAARAAAVQITREIASAIEHNPELSKRAAELENTEAQVAAERRELTKDIVNMFFER